MAIQNHSQELYLLESQRVHKIAKMCSFLKIIVCHFVLFLLVIVLSLLPFTASDYTSGIFWSLYCLSFHLQLLITALVSFGHCIVSPSI